MATGRPTISDVAAAAGVSPTTVSHAFSGRGHVESGTRRRVLAAAEALGYRPSARARGLRLGSSRSIAVISSMPPAVSAGSSRLGFFLELAAAAAETALLRGYHVVLVPPNDSAEDAFAALDVDAALVVEPSADDAVGRELQLRRLPYVAVGRQPGVSAPFVDMAAGLGTQLLLEHLRARGARRIGLITGDRSRHSYLDAGTAYAAYCESTGQPPLVQVADEKLGEHAGYAATVELLDRDAGVDALLALVDTFATGTLRALVELGRRVPDDVLVATRYDGLRAQLATPPITALDLRLPEVAALGIDLLLSRLQEPDSAVTSLAAPEPRLVARASTRS